MSSHEDTKLAEKEEFKISPLIRLLIRILNQNVLGLIDTGAVVSLLSLSTFRKLPLQTTKIKKLNTKHIDFKSASGNTMHSEGMFELPFVIDNTTLFYQFHIVDLFDETFILGYAFLKNFQLQLNLKKNKLSITIPQTNKIITIYLRGKEINTIKTNAELTVDHLPPQEQQELQQLFDAYQTLFAAKMTDLGVAKNVKHRIEKNGPPIQLPMRRTPDALKVVIKTQVEDMLAHNIIRDSCSPYAAPVVIVPKKDGDNRFGIDYRGLNKQTVKDKYPLPRIDDTIDALHGSKYFTTLDLFTGYWQIEIAEEDKFKTAFVCELEQFEFNRMPFGLTNAPSTFQRLMNGLLKTLLYKCVLVYLDDIIVFSRSFKAHLEDLEKVFQLLKSNGLRLKLKKCQFAKKNIQYLGHIVSREGVSPNPSKIQAIATLPAPKNTKHLSTFLGMAGYYRRFIRALAAKAHPLLRLTRKCVKWEWGPNEQSSFDCIKNCLTTAPILAYPDFKRKFIVHTDASDYGIGAVLAQMHPVHPAEISREEMRISEKEIVIAYSSKH